MLADCIRMRTRTWRCVIVLFLAVAGVVTGLLAMHVVNTPAATSHSYATMDAGHAAPTHADIAAPLPVRPAATTGCAGDGCDPMQDMTAMVCVLALLATTLLLIAPAIGRALLGLGSLGPSAPLSTAASRAVGPPPPSRIALSVDRR
ncbi:hypothetical protein [Leifsonia virtsii]|uniref:DUF2946 domain-containing protein n=1 Tax=Leifsonia virtsii TaxID=3035915 RepID=A0ABT8J2I6_9MICO|nr:hypothetical protein [Leifsonia virtsii]MDN4598816.1 hypothetical protein [Leifsonia virtsii]